MSKYIVRVEENEVTPRERDLPQEAREGLEVDGFVLLTMVDGKPGVIFMHNIKTIDIARIIADEGSETECVLHQAFAIAEGLEKANAIARKCSTPAIVLGKAIEQILKDKGARQ